MKTNISIDKILKFMPKSQRMMFLQGLKGSEHQYYKEVAKGLVEIIESAPAIYETDGMDTEDVKPVLHYFYGNVDIYITEIDTSEYNQHFGYTSLGMGYFEGGYISLDYLFNELPLLNLDYHFNPETIADYKKRYEG